MSIKDFLAARGEIKLSISTLRNMINADLDFLKKENIIFAYRTEKQTNVKIVDVEKLVDWLKSK